MLTIYARRLLKAIIGLALLVGSMLILLPVLAPLLVPSEAQLIHWIKAESHYPIAIQKVELSMEGLKPKMRVSQLDVYTEAHQLAAHVDEMTLLLKVWPLIFRQIQLDKLIIKGASVSVHYQDNIIGMTGLPLYQWDLQKKDAAGKLPWVNHLLIEDSRVEITYRGEKRSLSNVQLWTEHRLAPMLHGAARMDKEDAQLHFTAHLPVMRAPLSHTILVDCHFWGNKIEAWTKWIDLPIDLTQGKFELNTQLTLNQEKMTSHSTLETSDLAFKMKGNGIQTEIAKLSAKIIYDGEKGKAEIQGTQAQIQDKSSIQKLQMTDLSTAFEFSLSARKKTLHTEHLAVKCNHIPLTGKVAIALEQGRKTPLVEMTLHAGKTSIQNVLTTLPKSLMNKELVIWLEKALLKGEHLSSSVVLKGNLKDFPFDKKRQNNQNKFEIKTQLDNVHLAYDKAWPALTDLSAELIFSDRSLKILAKKANIAGGGKLLDAQAVIPDFTINAPQLTVDTEILSTLQNGVKVIESSPLKTTLGKKLSTVKLEGKMALSLGLIIPLTTKTTLPIKVKGVVGVHDAQVKVPALSLNIENVKGEVSFTEESIKSNNLSGKVLGEPSQFQIASQGSGEAAQLRIESSGHIKIEELKRWLKKDFEMIQGEVDYQAKMIFFSDNHMQAQFSSDLVDLIVNAPSPLGKTQKMSLPSTFQIHYEPDTLIRIGGKYGDDLNIAYSLLPKKDQWEPAGAHIHFGQKQLAKFKEDNILRIDGEIENLQVLEWKAFLAKLGMISHEKETKTALSPSLSLKIENLDLMGALFAKTQVEVSKDLVQKAWVCGFDGYALKGQVIVPASFQEENKRDIVISLEKLVLTSQDKFSDKLLTNETKSSSRYPVWLTIHKLIFNKKIFNNVQARFEPDEKGYLFRNMQASLKNTEVRLNGRWDYLTTSKDVWARGEMRTTNVSQTLKVFGLKTALHKADGTAKFSLHWRGSPVDIDYPSLSGNIKLDLHHGSLHGANAGLGKILSILNIDNMTRRLSLGFSDVTKSGLAFDSITGEFWLGKGTISTNNLVLKGPSAKIAAFGQSDLQTKRLTGEITVMPNLTGSLPVAAAIAAGNPAVGAAVWAVDKVFGSKIQEIHRYRYRVLGMWNTPQLEAVNG